MSGGHSPIEDCSPSERGPTATECVPRTPHAPSLHRFLGSEDISNLAHPGGGAAHGSSPRWTQLLLVSVLPSPAGLELMTALGRRLTHEQSPCSVVSTEIEVRPSATGISSSAYKSLHREG